MNRPRGSNADEWLRFLEASNGNMDFCAEQISDALEDMRRRVELAYFELRDFNYRSAREMMREIIGPCKN